MRVADNSQSTSGSGRWGAGTLLAAALLTCAAAAPPSDQEREAYRRCDGWHSLARDHTDPAHCGVVGRRAGSAPGYEYTEEMRGAGVFWRRQALDRFLAALMDIVPGTTMTSAGVHSVAERLAIIDFLARAAGSEPCH